MCLLEVDYQVIVIYINMKIMKICPFTKLLTCLTLSACNWLVSNCLMETRQKIVNEDWYLTVKSNLTTHFPVYAEE